MKLLFDQNISHRIIQMLSSQFASSTSVKHENLINSADKSIWEFARKFGYIIVTQDSDFNDFNFLYGFPPKIIWIRTGNVGRMKSQKYWIYITKKLKILRGMII